MKRYLSALLGIAMVGAGAYLFTRKKETNMGNKTTLIEGGSLSRGYRNNNPLNIRYSSSNNWLGKVTPNTDGVFEQFQSMEYGYRAALYLIRKYISQGYTTIRQIVTKWAPPSENDTASYIAHVEQYAGISADYKISQWDENALVSIVAAMARIENGPVAGQPICSQIESGYNLL